MQARNGGSITPRYRKILDAHITSGKVSLHTHTILQSMSWDPSSQKWSVVTSSPDAPSLSGDYIVFATGIQSDIRTIPFLKTIQQQHPIEYVGGFPCLNNDLMWNDDVPLFITGRLAALRLGPGAPNLVGARVGAERIAWNVDDVLRKLGRRTGSTREDDSNDNGSEERLSAYASARDNRFASLSEIGEK